MPRVLKADASQLDYTDITIEHLENFAKEGFRTLVLAYREISDEEYSVNHIYYKKLINKINFFKIFKELE